MQRFVNNWRTTLAAELLPAGEELTVPEAWGALLALSAGDYYDLTLDPLGDNPEIVRVTANVAGVLTADSRGREGTPVSGWPAGTEIACTITAAFVQAIQSSNAGDVSEGDGAPSEPPENTNSKYLDTGNGDIYMAAYIPAFEGAPELDWQKVWPPEEPDTFSPSFNIIDGRSVTSAQVTLSSLHKDLLTFLVDTYGGDTDKHLYIRGTTFITVTSAAEVAVRMRGSNPNLFISQATGYFSAGGQVQAFDLESGIAEAIFTLPAGVYPLRIEAHIIIPAAGTSYPELQACVNSGSATVRRGVTEVLGDIEYGGGGLIPPL
jgi:hypothetical protein